MGWHSGSGYCLSTGSLFPGDELIGTMKNYKKTITMLLTAAVLLIAVFMTGCTKLPEAPNSTPSEVDEPAESDGFGVYVKLESDDASSIALHGGSRNCSYIDWNWQM